MQQPVQQLTTQYSFQPERGNRGNRERAGASSVTNTDAQRALRIIYYDDGDAQTARAVYVFFM